MGSRSLHKYLFVLLALACANVSWSQEVFVTAKGNEIRKVDFDTGDTTTVVRDKGKNFQGLVVRSGSGGSVRILVANTTYHGDIRIYDPSTGKGARVASFKSAHGVAVGPGLIGDVYGVNRSYYKGQVLLVPFVPGCADEIHGPFPDGCGPGGYGEASFIDEKVEIDGEKKVLLTDVTVARNEVEGLVHPGELLVLAQHPPALLKYEAHGHGGFGDCDGMCAPDVVLGPDDLAGYTPTGLQVGADAVLIATKQGEILKATASGVVSFVSLDGKGEKLSVGVDEGQQVVYATVPNKGGRVQEFIVATGAEVATIKKGVQVPKGVGNQASGIVPTMAGSNVSVLLPSLMSTFTNVQASGLTDANCDFYEPDCGMLDCSNGTPLNALDSSFPDDIFIPDYVEPFPVGGPSGAEAFFLCVVSTSADFTDTIENVEEETLVLGYEPLCETFNVHPNEETRFFYAPNPATLDTPISEGDIFTDISVDCGNSHRGRGWGFSYILPVVRDLRDVDEIIDFKLTNLDATLEDAGDDIPGPCPDLLPGGGPVPQKAFDAAGLGDISSWSHVSTSDATFGAGGNGLLIGGGTVTFQVKLAGFDHEFGTSDAAGSTFQPIIANSGKVSPGTMFSFSPSTEPYLFYFKNISGNLAGETVLSSEGQSGKLEMAIYRNIEDPRDFALFFDDGGGYKSKHEKKYRRYRKHRPDKDFEDLVVTATGRIETRCNLEQLLEDARSAFDANPIDYRGVVHAMSEFIAVVEERGASFDTSDENHVGELKARGASTIFMACKPAEGVFDQCPVTEPDPLP